MKKPSNSAKSNLYMGYPYAEPRPDRRAGLHLVGPMAPSVNASL